jgi:fumarylacetoacetase
MKINETHDPALRSWVESANDPAGDFPIQNLPLGVFTRGGNDDEAPRGGIAIGDRVLDLEGCFAAGLFDPQKPARFAAHAASQPSLNVLMAMGGDAWSALRARVSELLGAGAPQRKKVEKHLLTLGEVTLHLPAVVGDYTDFYASIHHATNVGSMFRPDNALLPNYKWVPIGYHGRASSIVVSGTPVRRPYGQTRDGDAPPSFGPSKRLDYEMEVGAFIGPGNPLGTPVPIGEAGEQVFGFCLVNDWSARDIQTWEYQPLGPFLAKSFATSVSPWIVTAEALAPFRVPAFARAEGDPAPLPYLHSSEDQAGGGVDLTVEVWLRSAAMRERGMSEVRLSRGNYRDMYWTIAQMIAHHTSNGCNLQPGDLIASGTVSGPEKENRGSLLELTWRGTEPLALPTGETRRFLEDGDEVIMRGWCEREGFARIGFGDCRGVVVGS